MTWSEFQETTRTELEHLRETDSFKRWYAKRLTAQSGACYYCGELMQHPNVEHAIPVSKGGTNAYNNLVLACWNCNKRKAAFLYEPERAEWAIPVTQNVYLELHDYGAKLVVLRDDVPFEQSISTDLLCRAIADIQAGTTIEAGIRAA